MDAADLGEANQSNDADDNEGDSAQSLPKVVHGNLCRGRAVAC